MKASGLRGSEVERRGERINGLLRDVLDALHEIAPKLRFRDRVQAVVFCYENGLVQGRFVSDHPGQHRLMETRPS